VKNKLVMKCMKEPQNLTKSKWMKWAGLVIGMGRRAMHVTLWESQKEREDQDVVE
jgi:hypothetical protein